MSHCLPLHHLSRTTASPASTEQSSSNHHKKEAIPGQMERSSWNLKHSSSSTSTIENFLQNVRLSAVHFPTEIVYQIILFCTNEEIKQLSLVSKQWHEICQHPILFQEKVNRVFQDSIYNPPASVFKPNPIALYNSWICSSNRVSYPSKLDWEEFYYSKRPLFWRMSRKKRCADSVVVSNDGRTSIKTTLKTEETNFSIQSTKAMDPSTNQFYCFELKILNNQRHNLAIGIADKHFKLRENFVGYPSLSNNTPSWSYSSNGMIRTGQGNHGNPISVERFGPGDKIGLIVDFMEGEETIQFFRNGKPVYGKIKLVGVSRTLKYWPTITLYSRYDEFQLVEQYSFNWWRDIYPLLQNYDQRVSNALAAKRGSAYNINSPNGSDFMDLSDGSQNQQTQSDEMDEEDEEDYAPTAVRQGSSAMVQSETGANETRRHNRNGCVIC